MQRGAQPPAPACAGDADTFWQRWACLGAVLVPGLALTLPSGYSYGAVLLLVAALCTAPRWFRRPLPPQGAALALLFAAMGLLWLLDEHALGGWGSLDRPIKYLLALPCVFFLMVWPPQPACLAAGIALGGIGAGAVGLYQTLAQGLPRASGFTNAIQYGDLAVLLALQSGLLLAVLWRQLAGGPRALLAASVLLGLLASGLSQSRGGWLALALLLPICAGLLARATGARRASLGLAALALAAGLLAQVPSVEQRMALAQEEAQSYLDGGNGASSVGHRLAHWRLAWSMGLERPFTGWGRVGYEQEKARRVAQGRAPEVVLQFNHAHNEALDLWAKHGGGGVLLLLIFYTVPLWLMWPTRARIHDARGELDRPALALCLVGVMLPLSYAAFGLTQVFLAHNSGNLFYLFMCPLTLAALHQRQARRDAGAAA
ncbi:polymerase [Melaminivora suipulveris]|uniref:Polymerase n=1 Tax=Melaminivora suipulveris TaxID=2109913 RepID=A0A2R3QC06_9BURK|nr:O-antigen ligase family protein [Melaminivora suipulveris]AVO49204.1 polymerase [Melaminivora suipulveris]